MQELTQQLSHAHVDRERLLAAEKEREERAAIRERQWAEDRSRLEQRLAALHGKASMRRKKSSGSSVSFRDDSALHVGDLRTEIVALQEENSRLASTLELLSGHSAAIVEEQDEQDDEAGDEHDDERGAAGAARQREGGQLRGASASGGRAGSGEGSGGGAGSRQPRVTSQQLEHVIAIAQYE